MLPPDSDSNSGSGSDIGSIVSSGSGSGSSDYGYDLTLEEEELISAMIDSISPQTSPTQQQQQSPPVNTTNTTIDAATLDVSLDFLTEEDLSFDISELQPPNTNINTNNNGRGNGSDTGTVVWNPKSEVASGKRKLSPSVAVNGDDELAAFVSKTKPRSMPTALATQDVSYPDLSRALTDASQPGPPVQLLGPESEEKKPEPHTADTRSPLLRFRTFPKKPFSVSDLTAGAWCELQYYYTLTRLPFGRKTRTAAMKAGTKVHETLEREVFTTVQVEIRKKEDNFGLKIWNIIQGLRTLRDTGLTREMEVWGMVDGHVVNGIIDGLSYDNPDPEFQDEVRSSRGSQSSQGPLQQQQITEFYEPGTPGSREIFILDVKTRATKTPPTRVAMRGAIIQLFLYHRFLSDMAAGRLDYLRVFERYGLRPDERFSDTFMAQIGSMHEEVFSDSGSSGSGSTESCPDFASAVSSPSQLSAESEERANPSTSAPSNPPEVLRYTTLRELLPLLKFEIQLTFPRGAAQLGQIVSVEYRYRPRGRTEPKPEEEEDELKDGELISVQNFFVDQETLDMYLNDDLQWWKGEREPRGVPLEEANKCRFCEFATDCSWRINLDNENLRKARAKKGKGKDKEKEEQAASPVSGTDRGRGRPRKKTPEESVPEW